MSAPARVAIGDPLNRVDGKAKVAGSARYASEFPVPGVVHASLVMSTISSGRITRIDTADAEHAEGIIAVITPRNALRLAAPERRLTILQDDQVFYQDQPIAVVVAETLGQVAHTFACRMEDRVANRGAGPGDSNFTNAAGA